MAYNTNRQGAGFELEIMHYLTGCQVQDEPCVRKNHADWSGFGYDAMRSSGSRGKIDVIAILVQGGPLLFIQAKITAHPLRTPLSPAERDKLIELSTRAAAIPLTASKGKDETTGLIRPHFRRLTGTGPRDWEPWEPGEEN